MSKCANEELPDRVSDTTADLWINATAILLRPVERREVGETNRPVSLVLQGYVPLYVNATAGTTVYGAFDPIQEIADICEKYNLWLHVDVSV